MSSGSTCGRLCNVVECDTEGSAGQLVLVSFLGPDISNNNYEVVKSI